MLNRAPSTSSLMLLGVLGFGCSAAGAGAHGAAQGVSHAAEPQPGAERGAPEPETPLAVRAPVAPAPDAATLREADAALDAGQLALARERYEHARTLVPESPRATVGLVRVRWAELGLATAYAEAPGNAELVALVSELDAVLVEHPRDAAALLARGRLLLVLGDAERALPSLERAIALDGRDPEAHSALGVALLATGQPERALEALEAAARLSPGEPERLTNLGTAYMLRGRVSEAIATYERALAIAPNDARTHGDLGAAFLADGRPERALPHLLRATELAPERATFVTNLGYAYQKGGQLEKAVETQRRAIALDPKLGSAWINLGNALAEQHHFRAARAALERAEGLDPSDPRPKASLRDLAELEANQGRPTSPR